MYMDLFPGLPYDLGLECLIRIPHQCLSSVARVCESWKREIQLPEFWRRRKASGLTRKIVVMVQYRDDPNEELVNGLMLCEPEKGFWAQLPPLPEFSNALPLHCQVVVAGLNLVVMGGFDPVTSEPLNCVLTYNLIFSTWRRGADMPGCRRSRFACASDSDRTVFVAGGYGTDYRALKSAMAYDVVKDEWILLPNMTRGGDVCEGVYCQGEFLVIGWYWSNMLGNFRNSAESFNAAAWQWGPVQEDILDIGECPSNCVETGDGKLVTCQDGSVMERRGFTWSTVAELPIDVRKTVSVGAWPGKVLVIGYERYDTPHKILMLDLKRGKWEEVDGGEKLSTRDLLGCCLEL